jgi:hypothetical protein
MEGEAVMKSLGRGSFSAQARGSDGASPMFLGNASVLPNLRESLISIGQLTQDGYALLFEGDSIVVMNATTREIVLTSKRVGNLYPVVLSKVKLLKEDEILENAIPKALKTTASAQRKMAQVKSKCGSKISKDLTGQFDIGDAKDDSQARPNSSSMKSAKTWDRPENTKIQKLFTKKLQNYQNLTQDQAKLARARSPPKANFAQVCHERYNHTSVAKGSPLFKVLSQEFGKKFTDAPEFYLLCVFIFKNTPATASSPERQTKKRKERRWSFRRMLFGHRQLPLPRRKWRALHGSSLKYGAKHCMFMLKKEI